MTDQELIQAFQGCKEHPGCIGCPVDHDIGDCNAIREFGPDALIARLEVTAETRRAAPWNVYHGQGKKQSKNLPRHSRRNGRPMGKPHRAERIEYGWNDYNGQHAENPC